MGLLGKLVDSKHKAMLLELVLARRTELSVSGLSRLSGIPKASVSRIIADWEAAGIVDCTLQGRNKMVSVNSKFYLLPEFRRIMGKLNDFHKPLIKAINGTSCFNSREVKAVVAFGSRVRGDFNAKSDMDLLFVVSDKDKVEGRIMEEFIPLSGRFGIRLSPVVLSDNDFLMRLQEKDKFVSNILLDGRILKGGSYVGKLQATF